MKADDVMVREVATVGPDASLADAARVMRDVDCGFVPVVAGESRLAGVITDRDICMAALDRKMRLDALLVSDFMTTRIRCAQPWDDLTSVAETMWRHGVRRVPIIDETSALVGVVSLDDLIRCVREVGHGTELRA